MTIGIWLVACGNKIEHNIPVVVRSKAPVAGRPPNCLTEQANLT